jgi:rhomboid family GlyGly-CTERM serine protease
LAATLQFQRAAVSAGEWWRLLAAHLTHFDANHLTWDAGVLLLLGCICERESRAHCAATLAVAAAAITSAVWLCQPQFETYRGLSGLDCALFGLFAGGLLRRRDSLARFTGAVALVGVVVKSALELSTGATLFASGAGYAPVPLAHLSGAAAGFAVSMVGNRSLTFLRQKSGSPNPPLCRSHRSFLTPAPPAFR